MEVDMQITYLKEHNNQLKRERESLMKLAIVLLKLAGGKVQIKPCMMDLLDFLSYNIVQHNYSHGNFIEIELAEKKAGEKKGETPNGKHQPGS